MAHIVILGCGTGGMPAAYEMRCILGKEHKVTVINSNEYFQFVPSNPWAAVGWRKREDITIPIRPYLERKGIDFIAGTANEIDAENNRLVMDSGDTVDYDYLIITTGPRLAFEEVEGSGPHGGYTHSVCSIDHAEMFYNKYEEFCKDPGRVIIGAMPFASCFGPAYEFAGILDTDLRRRKIRDKVPMTFITSEPYIGHLGLGGVGDSRGMLESELRSRHIEWICNAKVTRVEEGKIFVDEMDENGELKKQHEVEFKHSMMLPAFKGVDAVANVEGLCNPRGFVIVDEYQRSPKYKNIYAAGMAVQVDAASKGKVPFGVPKTGYPTDVMGKIAAHNILHDMGIVAKRKEKAFGRIPGLCVMDCGDKEVYILSTSLLKPRAIAIMFPNIFCDLGKWSLEKYFLFKNKHGFSSWI